MKMFKSSKGMSVIGIIVLSLMIIGFLFYLFNNPLAMLLPIVIFGGIFLLYKYPPSFLRGFNSSQYQRAAKVTQMKKPSAKSRKDRPKSKTVPFRVIEGGKDDDLPKYH
ncbi:hypothetical protein [Paenibacillus sp. HB172176]|uniref:hypothetical protein n=1 Tax=Paenibacillus sp. HB172176 TaxID=2493690 RepID=UPI001F0E4F6F|nr:hypothetical protein [Paenibacillus sp. HB172176]